MSVESECFFHGQTNGCENCLVDDRGECPKKREEKRLPYNGAPPFQAHSDTSEAAAGAIATKAHRLRDRVLAKLQDRGDYGATDQELQWALGLSVSTEVPRRRELALDGRVRDSGRRRNTESGRTAVVWVAVGAST